MSTLTPHQVAHEAAFAILSLSHTEREHDQVTAIILSAAAKMVRESGAVEALQDMTERVEAQGVLLKEAEALLIKYRDAENACAAGARYLGSKEHEKAHNDNAFAATSLAGRIGASHYIASTVEQTALHSLRSITGEAQQGDS